MKKSDVIEAINSSFKDGWFRAADVIACLEYAKREDPYLEVMKVLSEMTKREEIETDHTHSWFRLKKNHT